MLRKEWQEVTNCYPRFEVKRNSIFRAKDHVKDIRKAGSYTLNHKTSYLKSAHINIHPRVNSIFHYIRIRDLNKITVFMNWIQWRAWVKVIPHIV
jgi:hypothetical protein